MVRQNKLSKILIGISIFNIILVLSFFISYFHTEDPFKYEAAVVSQTQELYLNPMGLTVGIKVDTEGIIVIGTSSVIDERGNTKMPAQGILYQGDNILFANNERLENKERLIEIIENNDYVRLDLKREGELISVGLEPVRDHRDVNRLGIWVRDIAQGIGTITYYNPQTGKFGALGHGIMDADTKNLMKIRGGEVTDTVIEEVKKGKKGEPGELVGFSNTTNVLGDIKINTEHGIYGYLEEEKLEFESLLPVAMSHEIKEDHAIILSSVEGEIKAYDVFIESVNKNPTDNSKGLVVKITDEALLERTNGIVQGMSGSPIIQNEKIIGAVTHVFVQDPSKGYGIFIENMLKQEVNI